MMVQYAWRLINGVRCPVREKSQMEVRSFTLFVEYYEHGRGNAQGRIAGLTVLNADNLTHFIWLASRMVRRRST